MSLDHRKFEVVTQKPKGGGAETIAVTCKACDEGLGAYPDEETASVHIEHKCPGRRGKGKG